MKLLTAILLTGTAAGISVLAEPVDWSKLPPAASADGVTYAKDIKPLLDASCVRCHNGDRAKAHLHLDSLDGILKGAKKGAVVKPGDSADSLIVKAASQLDPDTAMPPKPHGHGGPGGPGGPGGGFGGPPPGGGPGGPEGGGPPPPPPGGPEGPGASGEGPRHFGPPPKPLTAEQVGLLRAWIDQGAK